MAYVLRLADPLTVPVPQPETHMPRRSEASPRYRLAARSAENATSNTWSRVRVGRTR